MIIMNKFQQTAFLLFTLCVALLGACKPTPRTANDHRAETERLEDEHQVVSRTMDEAEVVSPTRQTAADLLYVCVTYRSYNPYRPWEMEAGHFVKTSGVYLGNGQVLTTAGKLPTATYLELRLPDQSRAVPARVIKADPDTNLALVTVQHEDDADIFDKVSAHEVGAPLMIGDVAQLQSLINDTEPVQVDVRAESANEHAALIPLMTMRSHAPLPQMIEPGMPLLKNGRIVGLVHNYESNSQSLNIINAEMIRRFLLQESDSSGVPVIGGGMTLLNDPVFRKYLKLEDGTNGLYVSELVPVGSAAAAGIRKGDVIVSVEDMPVNASGVCNHPIYGKISVPMVIRSLKPCGESVTLGVIRDGKPFRVSVPLNHDALDKSPIRREKQGTPPRYVMWGGMLFQPLTHNYLDALEARVGSLPISFVRAKHDVEELLKQGRTEPVALTLLIPTPATLGYDSLGFCVVEKVNGELVRSLEHFAELLDAPTPDGTVEFTIDRAPYKIYMDQQLANASNDVLRRNAIPNRRRLREATRDESSVVERRH